MRLHVLVLVLLTPGWLCLQCGEGLGQYLGPTTVRRRVSFGSRRTSVMPHSKR